MARFRTGFLAEGFGVELLRRREGGKMFGVLVVQAPDERVGVLQGFSGQLGWDWHVPGFVPPLFDEAARARLEAASDLAVHALTAKVEALAAAPGLLVARAALTDFDAEAAVRRTALRHTLAAQKADRRARRVLHASDAVALQALDAESKVDTLAQRRAETADRQARALLEAAAQAFEEELAEVEAARAHASREAMKAILDTYALRNARGEVSGLRALFPGGEPPWGAADCAAPKLVGFAVARGWEPLALAEFWWGPPPPGGGRAQGQFYPACAERCGPVLPFLLAR